MREGGKVFLHDYSKHKSQGIEQNKDSFVQNLNRGEILF